MDRVGGRPLSTGSHQAVLKRGSARLRLAFSGVTGRAFAVGGPVSFEL